eukprot:6113589-Lingulodinium_polyedra.AAC.1
MELEADGEEWLRAPSLPGQGAALDAGGEAGGQEPMRQPVAFGPRIRVPGRRGGRVRHAASTGRLWSDVCGAQPEAAEHPFGPRT